MALVNYSLPFGSLGGPNWATISPLHTPPHATAVNSLLYGPTGHQENNDLPNDNHPDFFKNSPYIPHNHHIQTQPQQSQQQTFRTRSRNDYLPPYPSTSRSTVAPQYRNTFPSQHHSTHHHNMRTYGESSYTHSPQTAAVFSNVQSNNNHNDFFNKQMQNQNPNSNQNSNQNQNLNPNSNINSNSKKNQNQFTSSNQQNPSLQPQTVKPPISMSSKTTSSTSFSSPSSFNNGGSIGGSGNSNNNNNQQGKTNNQAAGYPERPPGFTKVQAGQGSRTQVHAVLDYDEDEDYYDDRDSRLNKGDSKDSKFTPVTPIQGPIFIKNDSVPVLPLYAYPKVYNGTFMQIPIWWTALSVALGLNLRGDVIKGIPCVKRHHQLYCPSAGNSYPIDKIETFIDENKALMKRMYGYFEAENGYGSTLKQGKKRKRMLYDEDFDLPELDEFWGPPDPDGNGDSYFNKIRQKRQSQSTGTSRARNPSQNSSNSNASGKSDTGRVDACESKVEIVTPYWASNSAGKIRAIVNTQHFEQAIHQSTCSKVQTNRCAGECGCEQKYKWHRLLAYDPDNDCKGIFMDWFLFPSCCVCRCNPL